MWTAKYKREMDFWFPKKKKNNNLQIDIYLACVLIDVAIDQVFLS